MKFDPAKISSSIIKEYPLGAMSDGQIRALGKAARKFANRLNSIFANQFNGASKRQVKRINKIVVYAEEHRANPTKAEKALKTALSKWFLKPDECIHQKPMGNFILDFYIPSAGLCVEVDGGYHLTPEQAKKDDSRTQWLNSCGIEVVRYSNSSVLSSPGAVAAEIFAKCRGKIESCL